MLSLAAALLLTADLNPETAAKVQHDRDQAMTEVSKKYGDKKSSELSPDERREMIKDQREAEGRVLEKNGVDAKDMARYEAKMSLDDRAATKDARKRIDEKEKKDAADKKKADEDKEKKAGEIPIQRGFSDSNPVTMEDKGSEGQPTVEHGLPADAVDDYKSAGQGSPDDVPATKGSGKSGKGK